MRKKIFYGWWIVLATNLICMVGYGTWLYSFGVFFKPMSAEFGWTRAMTAGAYSLRSIEGGIASPIVGWAVDKYGSRGVIIVGAIVSGGAFALMPLVNSLLGFYLVYGILLSAGMSAMLYLPAWTVIAKWFKRRLSLAMALLAVGAGFGGLICAPASAFLIERYGWRSAFVVLGVVIWIVAIPLALVVKNSPAEMGLAPDGDPLPEEKPQENDSTSETRGRGTGARDAGRLHPQAGPQVPGLLDAGTGLLLLRNGPLHRHGAHRPGTDRCWNSGDEGGLQHRPAHPRQRDRQALIRLPG